MTILEVHHYVHFDPVPDLAKLEGLMSALSDSIASLRASTDAATSRVLGDIAALKSQVADLEAKGVSPADMAALDALKASIDQIDPTTPSTVPTTAAATGPATEPAAATTAPPSV